MKKILFLTILLLTGCSVEYNLDFQNENLNEKIIVDFGNITNAEFETIKKAPLYAISNATTQEKYNQSFEDKKGYKGIYDYNYDLSNFNQSNFLIQCFDASGFVKKDNGYVLSTSTGFNCMVYEYMKIDDITIKLTTNREVIKNNADEIKKDTYIWKINDNNASEKSIYIEFGEIKEKTWLDILKENKVAIIILSGIILSGVVATITIIIISKKNNEI